MEVKGSRGVDFNAQSFIVLRHTASTMEGDKDGIGILWVVIRYCLLIRKTKLNKEHKIHMSLCGYLFYF